MDAKNLRILQELEINSRLPIKQLAKKIGLKEDTTHYRIKKLQNDGIIKGFYSVIDYHKLGYITARFMLKLQFACNADIHRIIDELNKQKGVFYSLEVSGNYNIIFGIREKTIFQIYDIHNSILPIYQKYLHSEIMDILIEVGHYPRIFVPNFDRTNYCLKLTNAHDLVEIDEIDCKILFHIADDARISAVQIAEKIKEPVRTIIYRLRKLEKMKIIQGYKLLIDYTKLNKSFHKLLIRVNDVLILPNIVSFASLNPLVTYYEKPLGNFNLEIDVETETELQLREFLDALRTNFKQIQVIERISLDPYSKLVYY